MSNSIVKNNGIFLNTEIVTVVDETGKLLSTITGSVSETVADMAAKIIEDELKYSSLSELVEITNRYQTEFEPLFSQQYNGTDGSVLSFCIRHSVSTYIDVDFSMVDGNLTKTLNVRFSPKFQFSTTVSSIAHAYQMCDDIQAKMTFVFSTIS